MSILDHADRSALEAVSFLVLPACLGVVGTSAFVGVVVAACWFGGYSALPALAVAWIVVYFIVLARFGLACRYISHKFHALIGSSKGYHGYRELLRERWENDAAQRFQTWQNLRRNIRGTDLGSDVRYILTGSKSEVRNHDGRR